ncbi:MAG: TIGR03915 family putative DNA repair protein [Clostridia bacterium]|nr:TIGR03915 family putative DNA repair protein [Clostridia bacterium]
MSDLILTFDSTFDGFLSVVYHAVKNRVRPVRICPETAVQTMLGCSIQFVPSDVRHSALVRRTLCDSVGYDGFKRAYYAYLSSAEDAIMTSYTYILYALKYGKHTADYMSAPDIFRAYQLEKKVSYEADRMKGFLRFAVMEGGVEYAPMEPDSDILALLMPHFADRLKNIPFVIHDISRQKAGVCAKGTWFITDATDITPPRLSDDEETYRRMWKAFYNAISIPERKNERLQTQMMPKKYRKHMTEHLLY